MSVAPHKAPSSVQRAVHELRRLIFAGELAAGSDHLEAELAARLDMSRTPLREAALILENQGLVVMRPRRGLRILPVSPDDMREVYEVLTELESLAAARAARAGHDAGALTPLGQAISDMDAALDVGDREAWAAADEAFHAALVDLGGNARVRSIVAMMADQVRRARAATLYLRPMPRRSNDDHRAVFAAIAAGDAETARRRHRAHRLQAMELLVEILDRHRLRNL